MSLTLRDKLKRLASEYQELVFWMPPAIGLVFFTFWLFPQVDPRSGIDGFGQLHAMLVNVVGGIIVCFSAWLTKRNYLGVFSKEDILQLNTFLLSREVEVQEKAALLATRVLDAIGWILCFGFWSWVVF